MRVCYADLACPQVSGYRLLGASDPPWGSLHQPRDQQPPFPGRGQSADMRLVGFAPKLDFARLCTTSRFCTKTFSSAPKAPPVGARKILHRKAVLHQKPEATTTVGETKGDGRRVRSQAHRLAAADGIAAENKGGGEYRKVAPPPTYTTGGEKERVRTHGRGGGRPAARSSPAMLSYPSNARFK
jgi:hypothetical protein